MKSLGGLSRRPPKSMVGIRVLVFVSSMLVLDVGVIFIFIIRYSVGVIFIVRLCYLCKLKQNKKRMTVCLAKNILLSFSVLRLHRTNLLTSRYLSEGCRNEKFVNGHKQDQQFLADFQRETDEPEVLSKILKIGILGTPNVGKSTLINQIVGRRIFAVSKKVHTTQCKARAVHVIGSTQLVFLDTPGLVTHSESVRHNLDKSFMTDGESAILNADVIGVMHDVSNAFTRNKLDPKVLRLLHLYPKKNIVLILNKIDCLKNKRSLLDLADKLTCKQLSSIQYERNPRRSERISETEIEKRIRKESGWSGFQEVFMISAIEGFGIGEIMEYLLKMAKPGPWLFPEDVYTDQKPQRIIEEAVRSKLLDFVPQEIPYNVTIELELMDQTEEGAISAVVLVTCPSPRVEKLIRGGKDGKIRIITRETEEDLKSTFQQDVDLNIMVTNKLNKLV